jgi:hypothetical protein
MQKYISPFGKRRRTPYPFDFQEKVQEIKIWVDFR